MISAVEIIPGNAEWTRRLTCSRFGALMRGRGSWPSLRREMLAPRKAFTSKETEWGKENEPRAVALYEIDTGRECRKAKFRKLDGDDRIGGTADRLIGDNGALEVKCPWTKGPHLLAAQKIIAENYAWQCTGYVWIYELDWIDFASFDPREPVETSLHVIRLDRDERAIAKLRDAAVRFWDWFETATDDATHDFLVPGVKTTKLF